MKKFIQTRVDWIEKQFPPLPKLSLKGDKTAALSAPSGEIFYTLDGRDPRAPGGGVSTTAQSYKGPFALMPGTKVFARVRDESRWSGMLLHNE